MKHQHMHRQEHESGRSSNEHHSHHRHEQRRDHKGNQDTAKTLGSKKHHMDNMPPTTSMRPHSKSRIETNSEMRKFRNDSKFKTHTTKGSSTGIAAYDTRKQTTNRHHTPTIHIH